MEQEPWKYFNTHKKYSEEKLDMMAHQYEVRLANMRKYQQKKYHTDPEYKKVFLDGIPKFDLISAFAPTTELAKDSILFVSHTLGATKI